MNDLDERDGDSEERRRGFLQTLGSILSGFLAKKPTPTPSMLTTGEASHPGESEQEQPLEDKKQKIPDRARDQPHGDGGNGESEWPRVDDANVVCRTPPASVAAPSALAAPATAPPPEQPQKTETPPHREA